MTYASHFNQFSPFPHEIAHIPFVNLTSLSLSAIHLPYPSGDSSPVSELYTADMLPNLRALEVDECCVRVVSKINEFHFLRYLAVRCSCTQCIHELHLQETLFEPLELFEVNAQPYFLDYFRRYTRRLPGFKRLRVSAEMPRFRSGRNALVIMQVLVEGLKNQASSPFRHVVQISLPDYWSEHQSPLVQERCTELLAAAKQARVRIDFDVEDEGTRIDRETRAACFTSGFWKSVERLKDIEKRASYKLC